MFVHLTLVRAHHLIGHVYLYVFICYFCVCVFVCASFCALQKYLAAHLYVRLCLICLCVKFSPMSVSIMCKLSSALNNFLKFRYKHCFEVTLTTFLVVCACCKGCVILLDSADTLSYI